MTTKETETLLEIPEDGTHSADMTLRMKGKQESWQGGDDIVVILRNSGHRVHCYPSGIKVGVRLEAVSGTHGVHVDVAYLVDLRADSLWKTATAMKAAVLTCVNRSLQDILEDVAMQESLHKKTLVVPWGRIRMEMLRAPSGKGCSTVLETRSVYVISKDIRPTTNLLWLTDARRIINAGDLALCRQSDTRSSAAKLRAGITTSKPKLIRQTVANGWYGILALVASLAGLATALTIGLMHSGAMTPSLVVAVLAGAVAAKLLMISRRGFNELTEKIAAERLCLSNIGDLDKLRRSASENANLLRLLGDLGFVVSPLMVTAAEALKARDVERAVSAACYVLDECVRLAPKPGETIDSVFNTSDEGLKGFLDLMKHLGVDS